MNKVAIGMPDAEQAPRIQEITTYFHEKIKGTAVGKKYMTKMAEKKMDGDARLKELGLVFTFAGYGGTNVLVGSTLQTIEKQKGTLVAEWNKNADAVLLEGARLYPPVAGINPFKAPGDVQYSFPS